MFMTTCTCVERNEVENVSFQVTRRSKKYPLVTKYLDEFKKSVVPNEMLYVTEKGDNSGDNERSFYFRKP